MEMETTHSDLRNEVAILKALIDDLHDQSFPEDHRTLLGRVLNEIETWINEASGAMLKYDAQLALSYVMGNSTTQEEHDIGPEDRKLSLKNYLSILRHASTNELFSAEEQEIFLNAISEYEADPGTATTELDHRAQLNELHSEFDDYVAHHSLAMAIQLIATTQGDSHLIETLHEMEMLERVELHDTSTGKGDSVDTCNYRGVSAIERFERFGETKDVEEAVSQFSAALELIPPNHADRPMILNNLGASLCRRFERFGNVKDMNAAIERQLEALDLIPLNSVDRSGSLNNLGCSFQARFERLGEVKDIDAAIERHLEAVNLAPVDSADRPGWLNNLGNSLQARFERSGDVKDINTAIERNREAIDLAPLDSADRPACLGNLGVSLLVRFERFGDIKDLNEAVASNSEALKLTPLDSAERPEWLSNLGNSLKARFERLGEVEDLNSAILHTSEALELTPFDSSNRPVQLNNLGGLLQARFQRFGNVKDIDAAIERHREAVDLTPRDSADLPLQLSNLGNSFQARFERLGDVKDVNAAIERHHKAVDLVPLDSTDRTRWLNNLGIALQARFERLGDVKDIDAATGGHLEAVNLTPLESVDRPIQLSNLGTSLQARFHRLGDAKDINTAIERYREAVDLSPIGSTSRPVHLSNLGNSFQDRFYCLGDFKDIDAAIGSKTEAVNLAPVGNPDRPSWLSNLGNSLQVRFERFGDVNDIDTAIDRHREAVNLTPLDSAHRPASLNTLGDSLQTRFNRLGDVKDIDEAIVQHRKAVDLIPLDSASYSEVLNNLGRSLFTRFLRFNKKEDFQSAVETFRSSYMSHNDISTHQMDALLTCAELEHMQNFLELASEAYNRAVHLLPKLVWIGLDAVSQLKQLTSRIQSFGSDAAACMFSRSQSEPNRQQEHLGRALELLDQTRSVLWSQASNLRHELDDLRKVDPQLAEELDHIGRDLAQTSFRDSNSVLSEKEGQRYRRSAERWEELVVSARKLAGFEHFLLPLPISKLRESAKGGPVVVINISGYRSDALIILPSRDLELLPLSSKSAARIKALADNCQKSLKSGRLRDGHLWQDNKKTQDESLLVVLHETWELLGEPITKKLKELRILDLGISSKPRIWWCLTGELAFLPIHASLPSPDGNGEHPEGMMETVVSSYTPTLSALVRSQRHQSPRPLRMLAIGQPKSPNRVSLACVPEEIQYIRDTSTFHSTFLEDDNANVDAVSTALPTCTWAHFACHGVQNHDKPLESGLVMYNDQLLTLSRIARCSLDRAEFAFLSSCQSATGSKLLPNESVHLAAGLQFLGFRGVIGTMWSVHDEDALYVAKAVYKQLFKDSTPQPDASEAALALNQAVLELRDEEKVPPARWIPFIHFGF